MPICNLNVSPTGTKQNSDPDGETTFFKNWYDDIQKIAKFCFKPKAKSAKIIALFATRPDSFDKLHIFHLLPAAGRVYREKQETNGTRPSPCLGWTEASGRLIWEWEGLVVVERRAWKRLKALRLSSMGWKAETFNAELFQPCILSHLWVLQLIKTLKLQSSLLVYLHNNAHISFPQYISYNQQRSCSYSVGYLLSYIYIYIYKVRAARVPYLEYTKSCQKRSKPYWSSFPAHV